MGDGLQLLKGTLDFLILKTLVAQEELHGFEILDWIRTRTRDELTVEEGALYPALHRMEKRGLLASDWGISDKGRRAKYYRVTKAGRRSLARQQESWARYVAAVDRLGDETGP